MKKILFAAAVLFSFASTVPAQNNKERGSQLITNFTAKEYNGSPNIVSIAQAANGLMYFGTPNGLLEFDGSSWRNYEKPNNAAVRDIEFAKDGKLFVSGIGDIGYYSPDSIGNYKFHSLLKYIPEDKRNFSDVFDLTILGDKVYFNAVSHLFVWDIKKQKLSIIDPDNAFHVMFNLNNRIYIRDWGTGLKVLKDSTLTLIKGGEKFANERIYVMLPFPGENGKFLLVTRTMGMFIYDGNNFTPFKTEVDDFIKENLIYSPGLVLSDGNILLITLNGGSVIIDDKGKLLRKYNTETGLINNSNSFAFQDKAGAIWIGTSNGLSKIDYSSNVNYFDQKNNLSVGPNDIIRYKGILYVAGGDGTYYLDPNTSNFVQLKNANFTSNVFLKSNGDLLVGGFDGLFKLEKDKLLPVRKTVGNEYNVSVLRPSVKVKNRVFVGARSLYSIRKDKNGWVDEGRILKVNDIVGSIVEDDQGRLWAGTNTSGVYRITFRKNENGDEILSDPQIEHFNEKDKLNSGAVWVERYFGNNYFFSFMNILKFDDNKKIFYKDSTDDIVTSNYRLRNNNPMTVAMQDSLKRLWLATSKNIFMGIRQSDGKFNWLSSPFKRFTNDLINWEYSESNNLIWLATPSSLIKFNLNIDSIKTSDFSSLVRSVAIDEDSLIYMGAGRDTSVIPEIAFNHNSIKFKYAAASYEGKNSNQFKVYLEGFDHDWSSWSNENTKEYTNLSPGTYTFHVKALNALGNESRVASYSFEILPPFYRTWWAYGGYVILFGLLIFGIDRLQRRRVMLQERRRSHLREMELRTEAAELKAKALDAENERKKNIEMLSEIGKEITATLELDDIFYKLYEHVNQLADASVFGVGIYHPEKDEIEYRLAMEKGKRYPIYSRNTKDKDQFPVWCIENRKPVFINDVRLEYNKYIQHYHQPNRKLEDGSKSEEPSSLIYLPLVSKERILGVITIQSFQKNAYTDYHLNLLQNLASYTSIALDNADAYRSLQSTQDKLVTQEKLASLGALTAGIAHEIKNPLNFVNNFSDVSRELLDDLKEELKKGDQEEIEQLISDLGQNLEKINNHGKRADSIVKSMLLHSRGTSGEKALTNINEILDQYATLAYHGLRAQDKEFNISFEKHYDESLEKINIVPQDISRVFLNIINNACYAANAKKKQTGNGFDPLVTISTKDLNDRVEVKIKDNGIGIPEKIKKELFNPFFTTKPSGEGTGLGLSLSYDIIVKEHNGEIKIDSKENEGAEFTIVLPK